MLNDKRGGNTNRRGGKAIERGRERDREVKDGRTGSTKSRKVCIMHTSKRD